MLIGGDEFCFLPVKDALWKEISSNSEYGLLLSLLWLLNLGCLGIFMLLEIFTCLNVSHRVKRKLGWKGPQKVI